MRTRSCLREKDLTFNISVGLLSLLQKLKRSDRESKILVLGLDNSGKTTVLQQLGGDDISQVTPTQGFNVKSIQQDACSLNMWDIGGQKTIREYWRNHLDCTDVLVFVVDSSDQRRMKEASEELHLLLHEEKLESVPLLVLANKQDLLNSLSPKEIAGEFNLASINNRAWRILPCSARDGDLSDGVDWIMKQINNHRS